MTQSTRPAAKTWVFHAGALGDFVLVWPLLRALAGGLAGRAPLAVVAESGKARLAATHLGPSNVSAVDANQRRFTRLWTGDPPADEDVQHGVDLVLSFVADDSSEAGRRWLSSARPMFPGARIETVGGPGTASRTEAWRRHRVSELGGTEAHLKWDGPVVLHVGAGSREKAWPLTRWSDLIASELIDAPPVVLAGEAEAERFNSDERAIFHSLGGRTLLSLDELADALLPARLFIGADSGPAHLAAQLGIPTLALFGPTDPRIWSPVGPQVTLLAPPAPTPMSWLTPACVASAVRQALHARRQASPAGLAPTPQA